MSQTNFNVYIYSPYGVIHDHQIVNFPKGQTRGFIYELISRYRDLLVDECYLLIYPVGGDIMQSYLLTNDDLDDTDDTPEERTSIVIQNC